MNLFLAPWPELVPSISGRDVIYMELNSYSHGYGQITYHIVLVPKYRYKIFYNKQIKKDCELILNNICIEQHYKLHAFEVVEDHVHLFVEFHPSNSLSEVIQYLKGGSSYRLFKLHPELKKQYRRGSLWSEGKFYRSVGNVKADTIKHYIKESQKKPKTDSQASRLTKSCQRKIEDF
jgi:putative transposase